MISIIFRVKFCRPENLLLCEIERTVSPVGPILRGVVWLDLQYWVIKNNKVCKWKIYTIAILYSLLFRLFISGLVLILLYTAINCHILTHTVDSTTLKP
jgi:hypothetical protein